MTAPRAFLHVTTFYPPYGFGGDANAVQGLAHLLADHGHHVEVVHCVDAYHLLHPAAPPSPPRPHPGVTVHALRTRAGALSPLVTHATGRPGLKRARIRDVIASRRWDVIHFHNISLLGPGVLTLAPDDPHTVVLYTALEHWLVCPTHVLWKFGRRPCDRPACLRCTLLARRPPQLWRATSLLVRAAARVDRFIAPTHAVAAMHAARGFPYPFARLPLYVPPPPPTAPGPRPHDRPYFLYVGRLEPMKGIRELVDAWPRAGAGDLVIAGTGSLEPWVRRRAGDQAGVRALGEVPRDALDRWYRHALGCIVPTVGYETFGLVVLEALARRVPVIARDVGALGEVAAESGGALLFRDDAGLIAAVQRLGASPALRAELGERGYRTWQARWSPEVHLREYLALIDAVARDKRGAAAAVPR